MTEGDDFGTEIEDSSGYMDRLFEAKTKLELTIGYINEKLAEDRAPKPPSQETKPTTKAEDTVLPAVKKVESQIKLPKIVIKEYDGSLLNWSNFWGQFNQSVDKQEDLSNKSSKVQISEILLSRRGRTSNSRFVVKYRQLQNSEISSHV